MDDLSAPLQVSRPSLWIVRHGETEWARTGRHTGRTDIPLTTKGRRQALALQPRLAGHRFAAIVSSPLIRALDTSRLAGFETVVEVDPDLMEWDYGADEGRTSEQIRAERPDWTIWNTGPLDGESVDSVGSRVDRVIAAALSRRGDTLAFAHGHVLRVLAARWIGLPPAAGGSFALGTATVSILGWDGEAPVIRRWNVGDGLD